MSITDNIDAIRTRIADTAKTYGRDLEDINLIAVSKKQAPARVQEALECGHRLFGENRVQEALEHWPAHKAQYPDLNLHFIGPLQTNKVKEAVSLFDVIETVDRPKLVDALVAEIAKQNKTTHCFVQVNTGEEEQKSGVYPAELPALLAHCEKTGLNIEGLMCIPPVDEPPALHFALLKKLSEENNIKELSMGMSADFEKAIALGATYIRVGSAFFGPRV